MTNGEYSSFVIRHFPSAMPKHNTQPWYKNGLRFKCTACGNCCTGAPGFVWVNKEEIAALAARLRLGVEEFESRFVRAIGVRKSLIEYENGDCVFFDNATRKCRVYEHRPRQCRTWPFWESNVRTPEAWAETCRVCPGSGTGKLYQLEDIDAQKTVIHI
jgi:Fe-S-cluster containining protein